MTHNAKSTRTDPGRRSVRLLSMLLIALVAPGCDRGGPVPPGRGRVLLVGLDAATLRVVTPLMQEGLLPNLARIANAGVHGPLQSFLPLESPRIWNTIATGKVPEKHGILSFTKRQPDGSSALYLSADRKTHALWNITSDAGLATAVINWWTTFPPDRIDGVMVSDHLSPKKVEEIRGLFNASDTDPAAPTTHPSS
jgi:predicted AlkP superfamily phosphohydrolase/phosphomutase